MNYSYNISAPTYRIGELKKIYDNPIDVSMYGESNKNNTKENLVSFILITSISVAIYASIMLIVMGGLFHMDDIKHIFTNDTYITEDIPEQTIVIENHDINENSDISAEKKDTVEKSNVEVHTVYKEEMDTDEPIIPGEILTEEESKTVMRADPLLYKAVQAEAGNQGSYGKSLVASVILNRVESDDFPDDIHGVLYESHQFQVASNGKLKKAVPDEETIAAVNEVLDNGVCTDATYFRAGDGGWHNTHLQRLFKHGGHVFYKART